MVFHEGEFAFPAQAGAMLEDEVGIDRQAIAREHPGFRLDGEDLALDQHAIAVEDDQVEAGTHSGSPRTRRGKSPTTPMAWRIAIRFSGLARLKAKKPRSRARRTGGRSLEKSRTSPSVKPVSSKLSKRRQ